MFGGYSDERGDAMRNSMSLLTALHETDRILEVSTWVFEISFRIMEVGILLGGSIRILEVGIL